MSLYKKIAGLLLAGVLWSAPAQAQLWSSLLDPSRATDWTQAGVPGGIPNRTTVCTTLSPGASATQINTAIQNCSISGGGVVQLSAGTFNLTSAIVFNGGSSTSTAQNVTLRGAGPNLTTLQFNDTFSGCTNGSFICITDWGWSLSHCDFSNPSANQANWTSGYTAGTQVITLSTTTGATDGALQPNMLLYLDQLDAPLTDFTNFVPFPNQSSTYVATPICQTRAGRCVWEVHTVVQVVGNQVTITPPLAYHAWNAHGNDQPQAIWCSGPSNVAYNDGVENLTVSNNTTTPSSYGITFLGASNGWVKNVRFINAINAAFRSYLSTNIEIRDSYAVKISAPSGCLSLGTQYGVDPEQSSFVKIENNIFQQHCTPLMLHSCSACVAGYNFTVGDLTVNNAGLRFGWATFIGHSGGTHSTLFEGNISNAFSPDHSVSHGANAGFHVAFRNYFSGQQTPGSTVLGYPAFHQGYNRLSSWIGNVLGNSLMVSQGWAYQSVPGAHVSNGSDGGAIWSIGAGCGINAENSCGIQDDSITLSSLMRWYNYDYVTGTTRCFNSEVPSPGTSPYLQSIPGSCNAPTSFYLSAKPSWFGSAPWPVIGPDVTGGYDASGHVGSNPARTCYLTVMLGPSDGSGGALSFDANSCYSGSLSVLPQHHIPTIVVASCVVLVLLSAYLWGFYGIRFGGHSYDRRLLSGRSSFHTESMGDVANLSRGVLANKEGSRTGSSYRP